MFLISLTSFQLFATVDQVAKNGLKSLSSEVTVSAIMQTDTSSVAVDKFVNELKQDKDVSRIKVQSKEQAKKAVTSGDGKDLYNLVPESKFGQVINVYADSSTKLNRVKSVLESNKLVAYTSKSDSQTAIFDAIDSIKEGLQVFVLILSAVISVIVFISTRANNISMQSSMNSMRMNGADLYFTYSPSFFSNLFALSFAIVVSVFTNMSIQSLVKSALPTIKPLMTLNVYLYSLTFAVIANIVIVLLVTLASTLMSTFKKEVR